MLYITFNKIHSKELKKSDFCPHAFNFGATLLCVGDFPQKIV